MIMLSLTHLHQLPDKGASQTGFYKILLKRNALRKTLRLSHLPVIWLYRSDADLTGIKVVNEKTCTAFFRAIAPSLRDDHRHHIHL
jgi:hypothetical protein